MLMIVQIFLLIVGFFLLIKGADFLVDGASGVAKKFRVSAALIGLTIVAFGTSAPEISVAFQSFAAGSTDITLGDVIGCAISNVLLLMGIGALIRPIKIQKETIKFEIPMYVGIAGVFVALLLFSPEKMISRVGGAILLAMFAGFLAYTVSLAKKKKRATAAEKKEQKEAEKRFKSNIALVILGLLGVIFGSSLVVDNAQLIAEALGVSERVIAMTIVALGTSLPELITTITASRKNEQELMVGNAIGSNIFNICFVLGLPIVIFGGLSVANFSSFDLIMMGVAAVLLVVFGFSGKKITRLEGAMMLVVFVLYYIVLFIGPENLFMLA